MTNQHDGITLPGELLGLQVNLGHQRAGRIDHLQVAFRRLFADGGRDTMGTIDRTLTGGDLVELFDKDRTFLLELLNHVPVVDDLFPHVNRRAKGLQGDLDDVNCAHDACTEASWSQQDNFLLGGRYGSCRNRHRKSFNYSNS